MGKMVTKEWRQAKSAENGFCIRFTAEIIQVLDSIAWVRCASCNVFIPKQPNEKFVKLFE